MIVNGLDDGKAVEEYTSTQGHAGEKEAGGGPDGVEEMRLHRVVVHCSIDVGNDQAVVLLVDVFVQVLVRVH